MLTVEQKTLVQKIAAEKGFKDFTLSVEPGSKKGDNYLGTIHLINIKENDGSKKDSLILKCSLDNEEVRRQMPIDKLYAREVFMYQTVLPAFRELQKKHPVPHPFEASAKIYGYSLEDKKEWLLLQNVKDQGFQLINRKIGMDGHHVSVVFKELAKLHSMSFAMKQFDADKFNSFKKELFNLFSKEAVDTWTEAAKMKYQWTYKAMEGDEAAIEMLKKNEPNIRESFEEFDKEMYQMVVVHGDPCCDNMMFDFKDEAIPTKPTNLRFLDWQNSKVSTPVADLCYFLVLCGSKDVLDNHKQYLDEYYNVVKENLTAWKMDTEKVFPRELFMEHWAKYAKVGLFVLMNYLNVIMREEKDVRTFTEIAEDGHNIFRTFLGGKEPLDEKSEKRLRDLVTMLVKNNYL